MKRISAILASGLLVGVIAQAYDEPAVNLGFTSFLDGGPPAGPGFYFTEYLQYYHGGKFADPNGDSIVLPGAIEPDVDVFISLSQLIYQSDKKVLFGGKWGLDLILPIVGFDLDPDQPFISDNNPGMGDLLIGPYLQWDPIMGKKGPVFMHRFEFQMLVPTGKYDNKENLNPGSNFFSIDPYWAATWFPTPKCTLSWRIHYLWNDKNNDPFVGYGASDARAGQAIHLNFATSYELMPKRLRAGINGYYFKQITDSQVGGVDVAGKEQVFGIGPGMIYSFSQNDHLFLNVYFEMAAENRTEGERVNLRWVHHF
jgi:anthranilate 1,2-dioxygenase (deaminating, decarboxylating) large subunit